MAAKKKIENEGDQYSVPDAWFKALAGHSPVDEPTVGRIVHYYQNEADGPHPAIVSAVYKDNVALTVFGVHVTGIKLDVLHQNDAPPRRPYWCWPPRN